MTEKLTEVIANNKDKVIEKTKKNKVEVTKIYLGPSIPNVITNGTIIKGKIAEEFIELQERLPAIKGLFIDIRKAHQVVCDIELKRGVFYEYYKKVLEYIKTLNK